MFDIWGFLLQTLNISGVALLLIIIKLLFKDKLPPKWHFAVWSMLGIVMLMPAGFNGRYTLFRWQIIVELIKLGNGDYSLTQVLYPIPILKAVPKTREEWIFAIYVVGVLIHLIKYPVSYLRLRRALRNHITPEPELLARIQHIANTQKVKVKRVIAVPGLPGAFVCGIICPILVVSADDEIDDKVLLHELLHLKYRDNIWSVVICMLRCLQWCNPIVIYCAHQALNDMEARCDQHVLEILEGEDRRDYGRILLSMANERFTKIPGSTCINNGGKKIRKRIEAIARFKLYPVGMRLVSVCAIILLALSLVVGVQAFTVYNQEDTSMSWSIASARSAWCTTPAGAFDTYAKSLLDRNDVYRIMCAPIDMHEDMTNELIKQEKEGLFCWDVGLLAEPDWKAGYCIYNMKVCDNNTYEGTLVIKLQYSPYEDDEEEDDKMYLAVQNVRVFREKSRWVAMPLGDFRYVESFLEVVNSDSAANSGLVYSAECDDFLIEVEMHTVISVGNIYHNNGVMIMVDEDMSQFDTAPDPVAEYTNNGVIQRARVTHLGPEKDREDIIRIGLACANIYDGDVRPDKLLISSYDSTFTSGEEGFGFNYEAEKGWGPEITDKGSSYSLYNTETIFPEYIAADLYVNNELVEKMNLYRQEGASE